MQYYAIHGMWCMVLYGMCNACAVYLPTFPKQYNHGSNRIYVNVPTLSFIIMLSTKSFPGKFVTVKCGMLML